MDSSINILLVEDQPADAELISRYLEKTDNKLFRLVVEGSMAQAKASFQTMPFHLILLDQNLPDSHGDSTLSTCLSWCQSVPIIVLTGMGDEEDGAQKVRQGAHDYLVKGSFDAGLLIRVMRYTLERDALRKDMALLKLKEQKAKELKSLEALDQLPSGSLKKGTILGTAPTYYSDLVKRYEEFIEAMFENRIFRQNRADVSDKIKEFTAELGRFGAGPREIVDIHSTALEHRLQGQPEAKIQIYLEEARLLLLETMGSMVQTYRSKFTIRESPSSKHDEHS